MAPRRDFDGQYGQFPEHLRPHLHWLSYRRLRRLSQLRPEAQQDSHVRGLVLAMAECLEYLNGLADRIVDSRAPKRERRGALQKLQWTVRTLRPQGRPKAMTVEDVAFSGPIIQMMYDQFVSLAAHTIGQQLGNDASSMTVELIRSAIKGETDG